eukprot:scaffold1112_cov92-Amphora_coffeaeformis.AAC.4
MILLVPLSWSLFVVVAGQDQHGASVLRRRVVQNSMMQHHYMKSSIMASTMSPTSTSKSTKGGKGYSVEQDTSKSSMSTKMHLSESSSSKGKGGNRSSGSSSKTSKSATSGMHKKRHPSQNVPSTKGSSSSSSNSMSYKDKEMSSSSRMSYKGTKGKGQPSLPPSKGKPPVIPSRSPPIVLPGWTAASAVAWGDPHIVTYDRLGFDCQGRGDFVLAQTLDADAMLQVQARFTAPTVDFPEISITTAMAATVQGMGKVEIYTASEITPESFVMGQCPLNLYVDGTLRDLNFGYIGEDLFVETFEDKVDIYFGNTALVLTVIALPWLDDGCFLNTFIGISDSTPVVGLLGGLPNGGVSDDWQIGPDEFFSVPTTEEGLMGKEAYDYCTQQWCVRDQVKSLFTIKGEPSLQDTCDYPFPGVVDTMSAPGGILGLCGNDYAACLIDGTVGGPAGAAAAVEVRTQLTELDARTLSPSQGPSSSPTIAPSAFPSSLPSSSPSQQPTDLPSMKPSDGPSSSPSSHPSHSPSASPSISPTGDPTSLVSVVADPTVMPSLQPSQTPTSSPSRQPSLQPTTSSQPTLSVCACNPPEYTFQLDFDAACNNSAVGGPGIEAFQCTVAAPEANANDFRPILVTSIRIREIDQNDADVTVETIDGNKTNGETFTFSSIIWSISNLNPMMRPKALIITLTAANAAGQQIDNAWGISFTNECDNFPILFVGDQIGWTKFVEVTPPDSFYCPEFESPSAIPTALPSESPAGMPSVVPTELSSTQPSVTPVGLQSAVPTELPSALPSVVPTELPSVSPVGLSSVVPTELPSAIPTELPSAIPTELPSVSPVGMPSVVPTELPSTQPSVTPVGLQSAVPTELPSALPSVVPTELPSVSPVGLSSAVPTELPSAIPTELPSAIPTELPSVSPVGLPSAVPSVSPVGLPSVVPTELPSTQPSVSPVGLQSAVPTGMPTSAPSTFPSVLPSTSPSNNPTKSPTPPPLATQTPSTTPTSTPSSSPTGAPSIGSSTNPTNDPTLSPSTSPSSSPSSEPSASPSKSPTYGPSESPSKPPTPAPTPPVTDCSSLVDVNALAENPIEFVTDRSCMSTDVLQEVTLSYNPAGLCGNSTGNQTEIGAERCVDLIDLPDKNQQVFVRCQNLFGNEIALAPSTVGPGDLIVVDLTSTEFDTEIMNCTVGNGTDSLSGPIFQWNLIDVSGLINLNVKETFGVFGIESCDDIVCPQPTQFRIDVANPSSTGGNIDVTRLEANVNGGEVTDLINLLQPNTVIAPNAFESVDLGVVLDVCTATSVIVEVLVEAQSPNCDLATYNFTLNVA